MVLALSTFEQCLCECQWRLAGWWTARLPLLDFLRILSAALTDRWTLVLDEEAVAWLRALVAVDRRESTAERGDGRLGVRVTDGFLTPNEPRPFTEPRLPGACTGHELSSSRSGAGDSGGEASTGLTGAASSTERDRLRVRVRVKVVVSFDSSSDICEVGADCEPMP